MDHRWDQVIKKPGEHERYGARITRDVEVERRDRLREEERRRTINQSPWEIGQAWYDQRDLYTRSSSIDRDGYGRGPNQHPEQGSYHYPREFHGRDHGVDDFGEFYEREAWPWANYHAHDSRAHGEPRGWRRLVARIRRALSRTDDATRRAYRPDDAIAQEVRRALVYDPELDASDIFVTTKQAVVTLEGTVADRRSRRLAVHLAMSVPGVRAVHNRLTVRHDDPFDANVAFVRPLALLG